MHAGSELTEREELVLRYVVQCYILTANPVGSRFLSKRFEEESISAATVRNVMADLEEKGYITHPHTSAGRVPTDLGYRRYVDGLISTEHLSIAERSAIESTFDPNASPTMFIRETSRLLATITEQLALVTAPEVLDSVLERIELVQLSSTRLLVVLSLQSRIVRTVTLELNQTIEREQVGILVQMLNERLGGLTLREVRASVRERLRDVVDENLSPVIRIFFEAADRIFTQHDDQRIHLTPAQSMLRQPEFASAEQLRGIVELIENQEVIVHLLDGRVSVETRSGIEPAVEISIGSEHPDERLADFSMITTRYRIGDTSGTIGLIGPKRMNYSRLSAVVEFVAMTMTNRFDNH
ncbi:MAG: heat-inducible transcription repressor HrcA [bacterium]|nr:heat-inducible transcription repressor HrcA [Candidatus Kapabacteria bacterium]